MFGAKNRALHIQLKVYQNCNIPIFLESFQPSSPSSDSKSVPFVARIRHVLGGSGLGSFCQEEAKVALRRCLNLLGVVSSML